MTASISSQQFSPTPLTQFFWDGVVRRELCIQRCQACGLYLHPPKPVCRACLSRDLTGVAVSGRGALYSWTIVEQAFDTAFTSQIPYTLAMIELLEQPRLMFFSRLVDCTQKDLVAGLPLEVTFRQLVAPLTLPLFRPQGSAPRSDGPGEPR